MVVKGNAMTNNDDEGIDAGDIDAVSISERGHDGAAGSTPATVPNRNPIRAGIDAMEKQAMHTLDPWEGINAPHTQTSTGEELSLGRSMPRGPSFPAIRAFRAPLLPRRMTWAMTAALYGKT